MKKAGLIIVALVVLFVFSSISVGASFKEDKQPCVWAIEDIEWSVTYGLINQNMLSSFKSSVNKEELIEAGLDRKSVV